LAYIVSIYLVVVKNYAGPLRVLSDVKPRVVNNPPPLWLVAKIIKMQIAFLGGISLIFSSALMVLSQWSIIIALFLFAAGLVLVCSMPTLTFKQCQRAVTFNPEDYDMGCYNNNKWVK
ncbi:hypothetical protein KKG29_00365, partial [Patescibacteria group bacterium]|nr:hypothetical protein [Patescibacteria group bacterium]